MRETPDGHPARVRQRRCLLDVDEELFHFRWFVGIELNNAKHIDVRLASGIDTASCSDVRLVVSQNHGLVAVPAQHKIWLSALDKP